MENFSCCSAPVAAARAPCCVPSRACPASITGGSKNGRPARKPSRAKAAESAARRAASTIRLDDPAGPAPKLGEHTREVLAQAGYGAAEIEDLIESGAAT